MGRVSASGDSNLSFYITGAEREDGEEAADCPVDVEPQSGRLRLLRPVDRETLGSSLLLQLYVVGSEGTARAKVCPAFGCVRCDGEGLRSVRNVFPGCPCTNHLHGPICAQQGCPHSWILQGMPLCLACY